MADLLYAFILFWVRRGHIQVYPQADDELNKGDDRIMSTILQRNKLDEAEVDK